MKKKKLILLLLGILAVSAACKTIWSVVKKVGASKLSEEVRTEENFIKEELQQEISADALPDSEGEEPEKLWDAEESSIR